MVIRLKDWISFCENYRCNKALLGQYNSDAAHARLPGDRLRSGEEISAVVAALEKSVTRAENLLGQYIPADANAKDIPKYADEKLYLTFRYIYGMNMSETASAMSVSRDTVYRIRRRIIARQFPENE